MRRCGMCLALVSVLWACGDDPTEPPRPVASVAVSPDNPTLAIGATVTLAATVRDQAGAVMSGQTVTWTSASEGIATVGRTTGVVSGIAAGVTTVTAAVNGSTRTGSATVTVTSPVTRVDVTARRTTVGISGTLQLTATPRDASGAAVTGRAVTWISSDESKARVNPSSGLVTGVAPGNVTITATSEGVAGTIVVLVVDVPAPRITGISPSPLTPGAVATINGENFDTNPADLEVTVAGVVTTVTNATATALIIQMPAVLPCQPMQDVTVSLTGVGGTTTRAHPLRVAIQRSVAVGELVVLSAAADLACNELPAGGGRYAIGVINHTRTASSTVGFELRGVAASSGVAPSIAPVGPASFSAFSRAGRRPSDGDWALEDGVHAHRRDHIRWMESERALFQDLVRRVGTPLQARRALQARTVSGRATPGGAVATAAAAVPLVVGATTPLRVMSSYGQCRTFNTVQARVVYVGPRSVVLEDNDSPLAGTMDADYVRLGTEYDNLMHEILLQNFGDPIAYDTATDNNQRVLMLFTNNVTQLNRNLLGFATACDLFPPTLDPAVASSNQAEIFYGRVPTSSEANYGSIDTRVGWMRVMRATVIHEVKHVTSLALRFAHPDPAELEESWLEEATAVAAEEFYARAIYGPGKAPWRGNATYANTMYCEMRPANPACDGRPLAIGFPFSLLYDYYEANETKSFVGRPQDDITIYGSGWLFVRWAADQYATDESAFFRALTGEITLTGIANIEARTGQSFAVLHPSFMMALHADDYPGLVPPSGARYTVPSWNTRDMFAGMNADFPSSYTQAFPLGVHGVSYGTFTVSVDALVGAAASYIELGGTQFGPQALGLSAAGGGQLPAGTTLRLAILRLQ